MAHFGNIVRMAQAQAVLSDERGSAKGRAAKAKLQSAVFK